MDKQTFIKNIKQKYPEYQNINDDTLYSKIIEKYPVYATQIKEPSYTERLKSSFQERKEEVKNIRSGTASFPEKILQEAGQVAGGAFDIVTQAPVIKQGLDIAGEGIKALSETAPIKAVGEAISPATQKALDTWNSLPENIKKDIEAGINIASIIPIGVGTKAGLVAGEKVLSTGAKTIKTGVEGVKGATKATSKVAGEIIPTADRLVNFQVSKALDLTAGDIKNINLATGNEVGEFLATKNLIRGNKIETTKALQDFFNENYKIVREEIGKVKNTYKPTKVPRYKQALEEIQKQVGETTGLEDVTKEINSLLKKKSIELNDVQRVKELLDEHFSLYKVTGDVKEGVAKQGLSNLRKELKDFIEKEVKNNVGTDIGVLNNEVSTAKSTLNAIEARSTRGLTASNLKIGDIGVFGVGSMFGGPLAGVAAVAAKKILGTSAVRLKFAKWLDGISDARKVKIRKTLLGGKVPEEVNKLLNQSNSIPKAISTNITKKNASISPKSTTKSLKGKGETPKQLDPLAAEARKYKSAEEFVKAQPKLFHSGTADIKEVNLGKTKFSKTFYLSDNADYAKSFGGKNSTINEMVIDTKAKLIDLRKPTEQQIAEISQAIQREVGKPAKYGEGFSFYPYSTTDVINGIKAGKAHYSELPQIKQILKGLGYDGQITAEVPYAKNIGIWNKDVIKTKSQLTDFYNKVVGRKK